MGQATKTRPGPRSRQAGRLSRPDLKHPRFAAHVCVQDDKQHAEEHRSGVEGARCAVGQRPSRKYENVSAAAVAVAVDSGARPGVTSVESEAGKGLKAENRRLRQDVAILKAAPSFFVGELDPHNR